MELDLACGSRWSGRVRCARARRRQSTRDARLGSERVGKVQEEESRCLEQGGKDKIMRLEKGLILPRHDVLPRHRFELWGHSITGLMGAPFSDRGDSCCARNE